MTSEASTLSELISDIYDAALDPTLWIRTLERFCSFVRGSSAVLYWHDVATERSAALHLFNDDPHYTRLYFGKCLPMNPVFPATGIIEPGLIYTPTALVPEAELFETRFHKERGQPQGIADDAVRRRAPLKIFAAAQEFLFGRVALRNRGDKHLGWWAVIPAIGG